MGKDKSKRVKVRRVHLELHKTKIYYIPVDVPLNESPEKENTMAMKIGWSIINGELLPLDKFRAGTGYQEMVLKREIVELASGEELVDPFKEEEKKNKNEL